MAFKNACFFSYRHRPDKDYQICIDDLYETLNGKVSWYLSSQGVFRDVKRLKGGDFLDPALAMELCGSACMVMAYIPPYFDENETYCAREFRAMQALETKRLLQLRQPATTHGLIIPIVCRGWDFFPNALKKERLVYNFEPYLLQKDRISKHKDGKLKVEEIARYVVDRVKEIQSAAQAASSDPCQDCPGFSLPSPEDVVKWVRDVQTPAQPLPGRTP